jgi:tetratricopeptide (TPR) repeat protein
MVLGKPMRRCGWRLLCGPVAGLVVLTLTGSALGIERKTPAAERRPPADRTTAAEAHYELGIFYHERMFSDLDQAIAEYEQAVKLKDDFADAHYHLGLSYHTKAKLGVDDKALYRKALREYKLYLKYLPKGQLAEKARQNIKAVESRLR